MHTTRFSLGTIKCLGLLLMLGLVSHAKANSVNLAGIDLYKANPIDASTISAGQPSKQQFEELANKGLAKVINLRPVAEFTEFDEAAWVTSLNMQYQHLPINGAQDITFENAAKLAAMRGGPEQPTLIHCASGNRVGALIALNHYAKHGDLQQALQTGRNAGMTRLESRVIEVIKQKADSN